MALILTLKEGEGFTVAGKRVTVDKILNERQFVLKVEGGKVVSVDDMKMTPIAPQVRVMAGTRGQNTLARICIEAPKDVKIYREHEHGGPSDRDNTQRRTGPRSPRQYQPR